MHTKLWLTGLVCLMAAGCEKPQTIESVTMVRNEQGNNGVWVRTFTAGGVITNVTNVNDAVKVRLWRKNGEVMDWQSATLPDPPVPASTPEPTTKPAPTSKPSGGLFGLFGPKKSTTQTSKLPKIPTTRPDPVPMVSAKAAKFGTDISE